jgi:hypothetical protein
LLKAEVKDIHTHEHNGDESQLRAGKLKSIDDQAEVDRLLVEIGNENMATSMSLPTASRHFV